MEKPNPFRIFISVKRKDIKFNNNKKNQMAKIRVNKNNSKVIDGRLYISLLKAQQIKEIVLQKLIDYSSSVLFPGMADRLGEYKGAYIRGTK